MKGLSWRVLAWGLVGCVGVWLVSWLAWVTVGHWAIGAAYDGRLPVLSGVISGQGVHEVGYYVGVADGVFWWAWGLLAVAATGGGVVWCVCRVPAEQVKVGVVILLLNGVVLVVADRVIGGMLGADRVEEAVVTERVIRLRKFQPLEEVVRRPKPGYLAGTDGLADVEFALATDERGFILPTGDYDEPDLTVFFVGGSTTECVYVQPENRFPYAAGVLVSEAGAVRVNGVNAGVSGNHTLHSLDVILNEVVPLEPGVIVMMHNVNDLVTLMYTGSYWNEHATRSPIMEVVVSRVEPESVGSAGRAVAEVVAPHLTKRVVDQWGPIPVDVDEWAGLRGTQVVPDAALIEREFKRNLRLFVALCRVRGIRPVLMTQQNRYTAVPDALVARVMAPMTEDFGVEYGVFQELYARLNEAVREVAAAEEVVLIDLDRAIPKDSTHIYDGVHLNDTGSLLVAKVIAEALGELPEVEALPVEW